MKALSESKVFRKVCTKDHKKIKPKKSFGSIEDEKLSRRIEWGDYGVFVDQCKNVLCVTS